MTAIKGKSALITGSTQGIGLAFAKALGAEGCNVVLNGLGDPAGIERLRGRLSEEYGIRAIYSPADLSRPAEIESMMHDAEHAFGCVDVLINNAVTRHVAPIDQFPTEKWDYAIAVNLSAAFHTIRLALVGMKRNNWGRIINMSSVLGSQALPDKVDYVVTKHGMLGLTRTVALETAATGITCNALCPGWVLTPHSEKQIATEMAATGRTREDAIAQLSLVRQPSRRIIDANKLAALAVFLCSDAGSEITGAALAVDGGWSAG